MKALEQEASSLTCLVEEVILSSLSQFCFITMYQLCESIFRFNVFGTVLYGNVFYSTVQMSDLYCTTLHFTISIVFYCTILSCSVLYCTIGIVFYCATYYSVLYYRYSFHCTELY